MNNILIIIPTLKRIDNQKTYNNLPKEYQEKTKFVVQSQEYSEMYKLYGSKVLCLPDNIKTIAPTREWIFNKFKQNKYIVFDDDLEFIKRELNNNKFRNIKLDKNLIEFNKIFELLNSWMDIGYYFGGLGTSYIIPSIGTYPFYDNSRVMTNMYFNGPKLPDNLKWNRCPVAEDFDLTLQLLTRGFKNRVSYVYFVRCSATNSNGGCSVFRDIDTHNHSQILLQKLFPKFVTIKEKLVDNGIWKDKIKLNLNIKFKKAYQSSQINDL